MATDTIPAQLADLTGLPLAAIAALPTIDLSRVLPDHPGASEPKFNSTI